MYPHYVDQLKQGTDNSLAYLRHFVYHADELPFVRQQLKTDFKTVYVELAKLELTRRGEVGLTANKEYYERSFYRIEERLDCEDFVLPAFLFILYRYQDSPLMTEELRERMKQAVLRYKYWLDEPGVDEHCPCYFTENHQGLFHTLEYLAGQLYPNEIFANNGENGRWHQAHAENYLNRWLTWRMRFGFSEWLSNGYYAEDILSMLTLKELAEDASIRQRAAMLLDLLLFDIAINSHKGTLCATSGRMYNALVMHPGFAPTNAVAAYLWGDDQARRKCLDDGMFTAVIAMAVTDYQPAKAIVEAAKAVPATFENRQRTSFNVEDSWKYGIDPANYDNILLYWSLHCFHHHLVIQNSRKFCPEWYNMNACIDAHLEEYQLSDAAGKPTDLDPNDAALTQSDIYTYRTPHYMLSCSQDYRRGKDNFQQHIWQATLEGEAIAFVTIPGSNDYTGRPNYFSGNGHMPKAAAYKNVLIGIYRVPSNSAHEYCSHAYFPRHAYDETVEKNGWLFGRKGQGYIALRSLKAGGKWKPKDPALFKSIYGDLWEEPYAKAVDYDYFVMGHANVWVCEMGEEKDYGSFGNFVEKLSAAAMEGDTFHFCYQSPSQGKMEFGWQEPLRVQGKEINLHDYKRYDNPYCQAEFDTRQYDIHCNGQHLLLDFDALKREERNE